MDIETLKVAGKEPNTLVTVLRGIDGHVGCVECKKPIGLHDPAYMTRAYYRDCFGGGHRIMGAHHKECLPPYLREQDDWSPAFCYCGQRMKAMGSIDYCGREKCVTKHYNRNRPKVQNRPKSCVWCGDYFTPKRSDAKYCCTKCRVYASRAA